MKQSRIDSINYIAKKTDFNKYRNTLSETITNAKRVYYNQIFDRYKYDMKKNWNIISETLNRKMKNSIPETMTINGQDCSDKGTIAESFNTFFASIGKQNELNIRTHQGSHFGDYLTGANNCNFAFHLIDNTTTLRIIKNTKSSTSKQAMETYRISYLLFFRTCVTLFRLRPELQPSDTIYGHIHRNSIFHTTFKD